jgi:hypothetical protein
VHKALTNNVTGASVIFSSNSTLYKHNAARIRLLLLLLEEMNNPAPRRDEKE